VKPLVGIIMGSTSDWETLKSASETLTRLGVPHETRVVSAHRTPDLLFEYASSARGRGLEVSIVQMPAGIPVGTLAIGAAGATNAALLAAAIVGNSRPEILAALESFRAEQTRKVLARPDPSQPPAP
jgi:5-(carboxyamino)imidazole ribonucleotide mutase